MFPLNPAKQDNDGNNAAKWANETLFSCNQLAVSSNTKHPVKALGINLHHSWTHINTEM